MLSQIICIICMIGTCCCTSFPIGLFCVFIVSVKSFLSSSLCSPRFVTFSCLQFLYFFSSLCFVLIYVSSCKYLNVFHLSLVLFIFFLLEYLGLGAPFVICLIVVVCKSWGFCFWILLLAPSVSLCFLHLFVFWGVSELLTYSGFWILLYPNGTFCLWTD